MAGAMKARISTFRFQLGILTLLLTIAGLYCLASGGCSLLTADQRGYRSFELAEYGEAASQFADPVWKAAALFREGDFEKAASLFAGYDTAEAAFNHGNALVMQGKYEAAVERYSRALALRPGWEDATVNRRIAAARAEALKKEGSDMTGGMLGADEIVVTQGKSPPSTGEEQVETGQGASDADLRAIWLRQVQTKPADFLRAKFAHQYATRAARESD
jgi:Ca-activated chloride channel family protein